MGYMSNLFRQVNCNIQNAEFRKDPVPWTGKSKHRGFMRRFHHVGALKEATRYPEYQRGKRSFRNLPDPWDDICRSDYRDKSWKRKKIRFQYEKNLA